MTDIALIWDADRGGADLALDENDLLADDGLETAVLISLFTDRRAEDGDVLPEQESDRRGWWGDTQPIAEDDRIGSRLWLLGRAKETPDLLSRVNEYVSEALAWLVTDKVVERVDVESDIVGNGIVEFTISIQRPKADPVQFRYNYTWAAQEARRA